MKTQNTNMGINKEESPKTIERSAFFILPEQLQVFSNIANEVPGKFTRQLDALITQISKQQVTLQGKEAKNG